jgi:hypothetical protein
MSTGEDLSYLWMKDRVVERGFPFTTTSAVRHRAGIGHGPHEYESNFDFVLVLVVERLPLDVPELRENVLMP